MFPRKNALIAEYELAVKDIYPVPGKIDFYGVFDLSKSVIDSYETVNNIFEPLLERGDTVHYIMWNNFTGLFNLEYNVHFIDDFLQTSQIEIISDTLIINLRYISFKKSDLSETY